MRIRVNGTERDFPGALSVEELLRALDLGGVRVAVEVNLSIVPRAAYAETPLAEGDVIEIVSFYGGG